MHVTEPEGKAAAGADALHPTAFRGVLSCVRAPGGEFWSRRAAGRPSAAAS